MNTETETVLKEVANVTNEAVEGQVVKRATRYYTFNERQTREEELKRIDDQLKAPAFVQGAISAEGRAHLGKRQRDLKRELTKCAPPEVSGETRDALNVRRKELEEQIKMGMLPIEHMRRNPVGSVDQHRRWEKKNKNAILEWKNIKRTLERGSDDRDLSNVETLRPSMVQPSSAASFMGDAQIPGAFAMTPVAKERWPLGEPKLDTPLKQAERNEAKKDSFLD